MLLASVGIGACMVYRSARVSIRAENNLHNTIFAVRLVEHFVSIHGRWPRSWGELEELPFDDATGRRWPAASPEIQRCVKIDFQADPREVARQDPMSFVAIQTIGPRYEFRDYAFVPSLQATIRKSIKGAGDL